MARFRRRLAAAAALAAGYFALALVADVTAPQTDRVIAFWPASGLLVAVLLLTERRRWPELVAAAAAAVLAFNLLHDGIGVSIVFVAADVVVGVAGAVLVHAWIGGAPKVARVGHVIVATLATAVVAPAAGALVAAGGLHAVNDAELGRVWLTFFLSNVVGVLLLAPTITSAAVFARRLPRRRLVAELGALLLLSTLLATVFVITHLPVMWVTLVVPIAAALRHGLLGASLTFAPVALIGVIATTHDQGPFAAAVDSTTTAIYLAQVFIAVAATLCNVLGAASGQLEFALVGLRRSEDRFRALADGVRDYAIFTLDGGGHVDSWTGSARRLFGYEGAEVAGQHLTELAVGAEADELEVGLGRALTTGRFETEAGARRADGVIFLGRFTLSPLSGGGSEDDGFAVVVSDVTQARRTERQLRHLALHDALTGLPNRALLTDRLTVALASVERERGCVAVLFCDVDRFKVINDSLGHDAGDAVLNTVADRLRHVVRPEDTVARIGGDEFVICCREVADADHAVALAERVRATLGDPVVVEGEQLHVDLSVGIALGSGPDAHADHLLRDADMAMYRAKQSGTGYALAAEGDRSRALGRLRGEAAVRRAFDNGELCLHYQPIVSLPERRVVALEALLRWNHPDEGLLGPGEVIPIAEETGLIVPIGAWVIEQALLAGRRFRAIAPEHAELVMNVNVSARQLAADGLVATVERALAATRTDAALLCLELTETELIEDLPAFASVLERLEALGVRIAIDDFGAGYSSLRYLSRLPIQTVKLDRSFVAGMHDAEGGDPILRAAVSMAAAFALDAVAEGIEREDDAVALAGMGYRLAQGFHFARPLPEKDAAALLIAPGPTAPTRRIAS